MKPQYLLVLLFSVIFSLEETPQILNGQILTEELIDETEKDHIYEFNENEDKLTPSSPFLAHNSCRNPYVSTPHYLEQGCNRLEQCTGYYCGVHSLRQVLKKFGIEKYKESTLAQWAGTSEKEGTSHEGIEKALKKVNSLEHKSFHIKWVSFSSLGSSIEERFKAIAYKICVPDVDVIIHNLYRNKWGHYETVKTIDMAGRRVEVLNSLGDREGQGYKGYKEWRSFKEFASYISGISQNSIGFVYKK